MGHWYECSDGLKAYLQVIPEMYPESVFKMYMINCPGVVTFGWRVAKHWIDPVTVAKISILGSNYVEELKQDLGIEINRDGSLVNKMKWSDQLKEQKTRFPDGPPAHVYPALDAKFFTNTGRPSP